MVSIRSHNVRCVRVINAVRMKRFAIQTLADASVNRTHPARAANSANWTVLIWTKAIRRVARNVGVPVCRTSVDHPTLSTYHIWIC